MAKKNKIDCAEPQVSKLEAQPIAPERWGIRCLDQSGFDRLGIRVPYRRVVIVHTDKIPASDVIALKKAAEIGLISIEVT
jgi:hypothetical protein